MKMTLTIGVLVALMMVAFAGAATHDDSDCEVTSSEPYYETAGFAVFVDYIDLPEWSVWVYAESNDIDGIQRDDFIVADELCGHDADIIIF